MSKIPVKIVGEPRFYIQLSRPTLEALIKLSKAHYDSTCRAASNQGGFLYGWSNMVDLGLTPSGTLRELDLTLKLVEGAWLSFGDDELALVRQYWHDIRAAINRANKITDWSIQL